MSPRPAPDLDLRREQVVRAARDLAEASDWPAVTMRRLAEQLGVTQPVLYSAFAGRQALIDAVALAGFDQLAAALEATDATPAARMRAYLAFATTNPRVYEAMFSLPSGLPFAAGTPGALTRAFRSVAEAFPTADDARVEVVWALWHGLAALSAGGRLRPDAAPTRLDLAEHVLADLRS